MHGPIARFISYKVEGAALANGSQGRGFDLPSWFLDLAAMEANKPTGYRKGRMMRIYGTAMRKKRLGTSIVRVCGLMALEMVSHGPFGPSERCNVPCAAHSRMTVWP